MSDRYKEIARHYESCLEQHGDSHRGVDWPKVQDVDVRNQVMADIIRDRGPVSLLDFGCGTSDLYRFLQEKGHTHITYAGLDISEKFVGLSKKKYPQNSYFCMDILASSVDLPVFDYAVMNGVFTQKLGLSFDEMFAFQKKLLLALRPHVRKGLAFNMMSPHVDWQKDGAFHLPFGDLANFLTKEMSREFVFRHDYGLYEYTAYVYFR